MRDLEEIEKLCLKIEDSVKNGDSKRTNKLKDKVWAYYRKYDNDKDKILTLIKKIYNSQYDYVLKMNAVEAIRRNIMVNESINILKKLSNVENVRKSSFPKLVSLEAEIALKMYNEH